MAKLVKLTPRTGSAAPGTRPAPARAEGLAGIQVTPPVIAAAILVVLLLFGGLWFFGRPGGPGGATATLIDTGTETTGPGYAEKHANGMDSSTESPGPAATNNGMDTSTGR